jgi:hypothetical protein
MNSNRLTVAKDSLECLYEDTIEHYSPVHLQIPFWSILLLCETVSENPGTGQVFVSGNGLFILISWRRKNQEDLQCA